MPMHDTYPIYVESCEPVNVLHPDECPCYRCNPFGNQLWQASALWAKRQVLMMGVAGIAEAFRRI